MIRTEDPVVTMTKINMGFVSKVSKPGELYGILEKNMSWRQKLKALEFARDVEPWLLAHLGEFGVDWFVENDDDADSLRLTFKDQETETYFMLAWMHGAKNSDADDAQS